MKHKAPNLKDEASITNFHAGNGVRPGQLASSSGKNEIAWGRRRISEESLGSCSAGGIS